MFTDIVGSTERAVALGDRRWRERSTATKPLVREQLVRFRGREIDTAGDGFLAAFDGPARGVRCAGAILRDVRRLGLEVRAGLHTGECEVLGGQAQRHSGAHRGARRIPGGRWRGSGVEHSEDLVAGSGIAFEDRGLHVLKGLPGEWHLYAVANG